ncbi:hypothetical protein [Noviherbaspirillum autotrophicum]|uniref:hypothetical protein n=1 Tax=Noviherbaspirillum autotrophicum TaxID=709839 RepID=UPI0012FD501B|nr:hypothetical protein [Noviherbaspirillum autotrophicum]
MTPNDFAYFMRFEDGRRYIKRMERRKDEYFADFLRPDFSTRQDCRGEWAQGQLLRSPWDISKINFDGNFP